MIKVHNSIATRDPLPAFLVGLESESLADLTWADPSLGVSDCVWWPEEDQSPPLGAHEKYGDETLTVDAENQRVIVVRAVLPWSADEIAAELADAKAAKSAEILTGSDAAMNIITSAYSANEKLSWPKQEAEAKALLADPNALAPLLRGIADTRGIALITLRDKVLANVEASEALTALVLGTQQRYEDAVKAATTVEEVQAIEVKYGGI